MIAHFIDINLLINLTEKAWIVSKDRPNYPIMVISKNDFKLFKSGIYKSQNNKITFNGKDFFLPDDVYKRLKVIVAKKNIDITNLAISLRPVQDGELLASQPYSFDLTILDNLKNTTDDIYLLSMELTEQSLSIIIEEFLLEVEKLGLSIKKVYYINSSINNYENSDSTFLAKKILLQHAIGFKTDNNILTNNEIDRYDKIMYYSNLYDTLNYPIEINYILDDLYKETPDNIKRVIRDEFMYLKPLIVANYYTSNTLNRVKTSKHVLSLNNIMTFESFKYNNIKKRY